MHFAKNIILALCIIFNPGKPGNDLFIKPSVYLMPREVFTNHTNWEMVKRYQGNKVFPGYVNLYHGKKSQSGREDFQVNMPFPDLIAILKNKKQVKFKTKAITSLPLLPDPYINTWNPFKKLDMSPPFKSINKKRIPEHEYRLTGISGKVQTIL